MFLSLFHRYGYIYKPFEADGWFSANEEWKLTDSEILKAAACVHPKYFIGCRSGRASRFAVLDIDAGSKYHNAESLKLICSLLEKAGIVETNLYRSSESGGWHLYIFFDEPISSRDLRNQLVQLFRLNDFEINKGTLEIFPNPGDGKCSIGQGLRLPLQRGFAWLNADTLVVRDERDELSPYEAISKFAQDMICSVNSYHSFHQLKAFVERMDITKEKVVLSSITTERKIANVVPIRKEEKYDCPEEAVNEVKSVFPKLPPGIHADVWLRGRQYYSYGLTGRSQRADAIHSLSHYLFYGDPKNSISPLGYGYERDRQWVIEEILKTKNHGLSKDIDRGRSDAVRQIERAANWVPPHKRGKDVVRYEAKAKVPLSWVKNNAKRAGLACRKIMAAVEDFLEGNQLFSIRDLALKSGVSTRTLYKHQELWKKVQDDLQKTANIDCLETVVHEYNAGVGQESTTCSVFDSSLVPLNSEMFLEGRHSLGFDTVDVLKASEGSGKQWRDRVACLLQINALDEPLGKVKALVTVWGHLIRIAPCVQDIQWLQVHIYELKEQIRKREEEELLKAKNTDFLGNANSRFKSIKFLSF
ncbi:hypothetical protein KA183_19110 [bacterium]|nr:hypothetical protein [bacterium]